MIIPVRCWTCGKPLGGLWEKYKERVANGESPKNVFDSLGIERYCCRALFLTHQDTLKKSAQFRL